MAGLIPQQFIDDLLEKSDIVDVIGKRISLKKSGNNYTALCPFHQEKTPSFSVNQSKQFYYCFGCGAGGNSIQFVMDYDRLDFPQSIERLAGQYGLDVPRDQSSSPREQQAAQARKKKQQSLFELLEEVAQLYQHCLHKDPAAEQARQYIKQRKLSSESINNFELGYAPDKILLNHYANQAHSIEALIATGMLNRDEQGQIYERFRRRVMFPIRDRRGRVVGFGGRIIGDGKPKYLNSPETELFHKSKEVYGLYQSKQQRGQPEQIIICEGYMDVISLAQHGLPNAVATLGTATSDTHIKLLFRQCPNLVFSFDGDQAGERAAKRALETLIPQLEDGHSAKFLFLPEGQDPDSLVSSIGKTNFLQKIYQAMPFEEYFFQSLLPENASLDAMGTKTHLSKQALPLIEQVPGKAYRQLLLQELQKRTGLSQDVLSDLAQAHTNQQQSYAPQPSEYQAAEQAQQTAQPIQRSPLSATQKKLRITPYHRAVALILSHPQLALEHTLNTLPTPIQPEHLLYQMLQRVQQLPDISSHRLLGYYLNSEHNDLILKLHAFNTQLNLDLESSRHELADCLRHIQSHSDKQTRQASLATLKSNPSLKLNELEQELQEQIRSIQQAYANQSSENND